MKATRYRVFWEPLATVLDDGLAELVSLHWDEVGVHKQKMPLDCDWERYEELEKLGILRILAARSGDNLVGYHSLMVMPHLHYRTTMHAMSDAIYVLREHRRSGLGVVLIDKTEADLGKELKKVRIWYHDKANLEMLGPVLAKRGYTHVENCWDKMVEV